MQQHIHIDEARIRAKAYQLWESRGCPEGSGDQDWLEAERVLALEARAAELDEDPDSAPPRAASDEVRTSAKASRTRALPVEAAPPAQPAEPALVPSDTPTEPPRDEITLPSVGAVGPAPAPRAASRVAAASPPAGAGRRRADEPASRGAPRAPVAAPAPGRRDAAVTASRRSGSAAAATRREEGGGGRAVPAATPAARNGGAAERTDGGRGGSKRKPGRRSR